MNRVLAVLLAACTVLALAACGGGNASNNAHGNDHSHDGHGHGDDHGEAHKIGEKQIGDYMVAVSRVEGKDPMEGIYEIEVTKDGKPVKDVPVDVFVGDATGKEQSIVAKGEWMEEEKAFDCHVTLLKDMTGMRLWVRLRPAGLKDPIKGDFDVDKK